MERFLLVVSILLFSLNCAIASTTTLSWDASPSSNVAGYKVYYDVDPNPPYNGTGAFEGNSPIDVGNVLTFQLNSLLLEAKYYFTVTAYDAEGHESIYSNIVAREPIAPDFDSTWRASDNVNLGNENAISYYSPDFTPVNIRKYLGPVSKGEATCVSLEANFDGDSRINFYARDSDNNDVVSSQNAVFINSDFEGYNACVVYQRDVTNVEFYIDFGEHLGTYNIQKVMVSTFLPEEIPVEDFWLEEIMPSSIAGLPFDDKWVWSAPTTSGVDSFRIIIGKTLKSVLGEEPEALYIDFESTNTGQSELPFTVPTDLESNGYFISLSTITNGKESIPIIKAHLPGNVIGTADDESATLFRDVIIDSNNDVASALNFYRHRTFVPIPGNGTASPEERTSRTNYYYIIRTDYYYTRFRLSKHLFLE